MNKLYFYCFLAVVAAFTACKKDNPAPPPSVETESILIQCYKDIEFAEAPISNNSAWVKALLGERNWALAEEHDDYKFLASTGSKDFFDTKTQQSGTSKLFNFSLRPPTVDRGTILFSQYAKEKFRMYITTPFEYEIEDVINEYINIGPLKLQDIDNQLERGTVGFTFECGCNENPSAGDSPEGIWYESRLGPQDNQFIECTKKDKRVENGKTYYDLAFRFSVNIYSFGNVLWTTFEDGEFGFTVEIE